MHDCILIQVTFFVYWWPRNADLNHTGLVAMVAD